jgi:hypothetical protein
MATTDRVRQLAMERSPTGLIKRRHGRRHANAPANVDECFRDATTIDEVLRVTKATETRNNDAK